MENNIDLLIDDSISNCLSVVNCGIEAIMINNEKNSNHDIKTFRDWKEIYIYIKNGV